MLHKEKSLLRQKINNILQNIPKEYLKSAGQMIAHHLYHWFLLQSFKPGINIGIFLSIKSEIDTNPIIEMINKFNANIFFPEEIIHNLFSKNFKIIFVPGLAFDFFGNRLGRGNGYYDKMIESLQNSLSKPILIALTLDEQIFDKIPIEPHDMPVDYICAPKQGLIKAKKE